MGLFNWLKQRKMDSNLDSLPEEVAAFIRATLPNRNYGGRTLESPADYIRLVEEYTGWAYACARKNAQTTASVPLRLYRGVPRGKGAKVRRSVEVRPVSRVVKNKMFNDASLVRQLNKAVDVEEVLRHPWLDLLQTVNRDLNGFSLIEMTVLFKQVTGNAYWLIPKNNLGVPEEIWVLPSQYTRIVPDDIKYVQAYEYGLSDPKERFEPENIVHFKYPNVKSIYYGAGPLEAAYTAQSLNEDFGEFERAMLDNNAIMPAVFSAEQPLSKGALKRLRKDIMKVHGGHRKAGKFGVLQQGLKLLPVAWNPKDINYAIGLKTTKEKIAGIFGVPLSKLGVEDVNRSNADAGNYSYMKDTITPECVSIADDINQGIMPSYDDKLFVTFDDCVPEDKEFLLKREESRLKTGVYCINEVREQDGVDPIDGGEEPLLSGTLKPLSQIIKEPEPMPALLVGDTGEEKPPAPEEQQDDDDNGK